MLSPVPNLPVGSQPITMSSREIADVTGSSHDNVLKTVRSLIERGVVFGNETPYVHPQNGQEYTEFRLDYRNTMVVVSGYNPELRAKIIDRWIELEADAASRGARPTPAPAPAPAPVSARAALSEFKAYRQFGQLIGLDENQTILRANRAVHRACGTDLLSNMGNPMLEAPHQELPITVTELGMRLGGLKARHTNVLLTDHGFQTASRDHKGEIHYEATELGRPHSRMVDQDKAKGSGAPVVQLRWLTSVVEPLKAAIDPGGAR